MPIIVRDKKQRPRLEPIQRGLTRMSMQELIDFEAVLWKWLDSCVSARTMLNAVHREVEWRAQDSEFE